MIPLTNLDNNPTFGIPITGFSLSIPNFYPQVFVTPDGTKAVVTNTSGNSISLVDTQSHAIIRTVPVGNIPNGVFVTPDSKTAYASDGSSNIESIINLTNFNIDSVAVGVTPTNPTITPDQAPLANFAYTMAADYTVQFMAATASPTGTIVLWQWDFGDGTTASTNSPATSHQYANPGNYQVTLTVTNSAGTSTNKHFTGPMMSNNGDPSIASLMQLVIVLDPDPPINPIVTVSKQEFLTSICYEITISWSPPTTGNLPVLYLIYSDAALTNLLEEVHATSELIFKTCSKKQHNTYYIISVDGLGNVSFPLVITT